MRFYFKYSPWRAVCLEGVEKISTEIDKKEDDNKNSDLEEQKEETENIEIGSE